MNLEIGIGDLTLRTPMIGASGLFGYGTEYEGLLDYTSFGALVTKTISLEPREGNPAPRIVDVGSGIINSIGLENVGSAAFLEEILPALDLPCRLIVSIGGGTVDEYRKLAGLLGGCDGVDAIEINISCPNVKEGGIAFGRSAGSTGQVVSGVRGETRLPIIAKVPPLVSRIEEVCRAACDGGADALTIANTYPAMAIDIVEAKPVLGGITGGLSGGAIRPMSLFLVWKAAGAVKVPIIGGGGIETASDAIEFMLAGACSFQIGTVVLKDLRAPSAILDGLKAYMQQNGYASPGDFMGKANG
jgi:dihydroorotate dehydrogenase (NAD+) catalytic subunit